MVLDCIGSRSLLSFLLCIYLNKVCFHAEVQDAFISLSTQCNEGLVKESIIKVW